MKNGFVKVAVASPKLKVADPDFNAQSIIATTKEAVEKGVKILVFPELCLTAYTCGDLFASDVLRHASENALATVLEATKAYDTLLFVGLPVVVRDRLYNACAICSRGKILGIVPKTHIPNYAEHSEVRHFSAYDIETAPETVTLLRKEISFGTDLLFTCFELPDLRVCAEICEDLWVSIPPSCFHTASGATVICNLSASCEVIGKSEYRRNLVISQSARTVSAYLYASSGEGESSTDLVFGAHDMIAENGIMLAEKKPVDYSSDLLCTEIDVQRIAKERRHLNTYKTLQNYREVFFSLEICETTLSRFVDPHPFVPADANDCLLRCETVLNIQSQGLKQRMQAAYAKKLVIGISGGLDSTLALLVAVRTIDNLKLPRKDVIAITMPCFGTTQRTKDNATILCERLGVDFRCIPIGDTVNSHFHDIGHDKENRNATYENAQARERTQVLMDIANDCGGLVVGTGDLSELALGWATYNGDHMSMYGVNASVPKTLIRFVVAYCADGYEKNGEKELAVALRDILDTPVSPELLPADGDGKIAQKTEDLVGPYEIHDFYLYYIIRFGFSPEKIFRLAKYALGTIYSDEVLLHWLEVFVRRFFSQQFKRSCLPDGPKVGSVDLSPRGDWQMPSDASSAAWLAEIKKLKK